MQILKATAITLAILFTWGAEAQQTRRDIGGLIGTTVYALDGAEIGTIADVRLDEGGQLAAIRIELEPGSASAQGRWNFLVAPYPSLEAQRSSTCQRKPWKCYRRWTAIHQTKARKEGKAHDVAARRRQVRARGA
jgi:sporulation protein YlmC with PRC-barrel domain